MRTHQQIDQRSLAMAHAIVERIDADPQRLGVQRARTVIERWLQRDDLPVLREWQAILSHPWEEIRDVLLDASENGQRLRQSSPFCGVLTPHERWNIYREHSEAR